MSIGQRVRYYYECMCGSKWSKVFTVGDGQSRTAKCFKCKVPNRHVRTFAIKE